MESVVEIAEAIRSRERSARFFVERSLKRIDSRNGELNAFIHIDRERAMAGAEAIDRQLARGENPGLLAGVPFGVKDLQHCKGFPSTYGSEIFRFAEPSKTSDTFIARLLAAGAIPVGITAAPEFGMDSSTRSRLWGTTRNPWNTSRTPGGSSGGSSAAVSAALVPFATAGDSAGSTRSPAAFTGTVGFLASHGRVPNPDGFDEVTGNGVITTCVRDTALLLDVMQGPASHDRSSLPKYEGSYSDDIERWSTDGIRVVFSADLGFATVEPECAAIALMAAKRLIGAASLVERNIPITLPNVGAEWLATAVHKIRVGLELMGTLPGKRDILSDNVSHLIDRFGYPTEQDLYRARKALPSLEAAGARCFEDVDVLLTPTTACRAFPAEWSILDISINGQTPPVSAEPFGLVANACWLPSISVPAGVTADGLPIGLMITGRRFADSLVLRLARVLEQAAPWPLHAPGCAEDCSR